MTSTQLETQAHSIQETRLNRFERKDSYEREFKQAIMIHCKALNLLGTCDSRRAYRYCSERQTASKNAVDLLQG